MFDLSDKASTQLRPFESPLPLSQAPEGATEGDPLDQPAAVEIHHRLLDAYTRELDRQQDNREQQAIDEDFYDNIQWTQDEADELANRGQKPLVYNVICTSVNWVLGTERRGRSDFKVLARRKEDGKAAERKSQLLKYLADCNRTPFHRSRAFADAVKVGIGWLEDCVDEEDGNEPICSRYESWRNMLWDSAATEFDLSDARYVFRAKWIDLDVAQAIFPARAGLLDASATQNDTLLPSGLYGDEAMDRPELEMERIGSASRMPNRYQRQRVRIIEGWFRRPEHVSRLSGGMFGGELYDRFSRGHAESIASGEAEVVKRLTMRMNVALFTVRGLLWLGPSPYRHNRFPFTPIWGNRRGRDGMPYGMIRGLRDIQEDINKRASKALHIISTSKTVIEQSAVDDHNATAEEISRPDAYVVVRDGKLGAIRTGLGQEMADKHIELMARSIAMIQQTSGITDENLGRKTNATAGVAIERRQTQGAMATTHYFDNLRLAFQVQGEKQLSLIEQFMTEQKQFRITNERGAPTYQTINDGLPENDIARCKSDFVISEADWRASMREAAAAELSDLLVKLAPSAPQVVLVVLDLLIESMDIHNRDEIVRRIREVTGARDPDADEPTPEEQAREVQKAKMAQMQEMTLQAQLRKLMAEAGKTEAEQKEAIANAVKAIIGAIGGPKRGAIDIAGHIMATPAVAAPADEIMRDAGYVSRTELEQTAAHFAAAAAQAQAAAAQAQDQQRNAAAPPAPEQMPGLAPQQDSTGVGA